MIVGGACRGYNRALRVSGQYVLAYFVAGLASGLLAGVVFSFSKDVSAVWHVLGIFFTIHVFVCLCLFLIAMVANFVFVRMFKMRTWRQERRRKWVAGGSGFVLTWGGMILLGVFGIRTPETVYGIFGSTAEIVHYGSWFVLLSNIALLAGWLVPVPRS